MYRPHKTFKSYFLPLGATTSAVPVYVPVCHSLQVLELQQAWVHLPAQEQCRDQRHQRQVHIRAKKLLNCFKVK